MHSSINMARLVVCTRSTFLCVWSRICVQIRRYCAQGIPWTHILRHPVQHGCKQFDSDSWSTAQIIIHGPLHHAHPLRITLALSMTHAEYQQTETETAGSSERM